MSKSDTNKAWAIGDDLATEFDAEELTLVNPEEVTVERIVTGAFEGESPRLRVLAEERVMKEMRQYFPFATKAADLVDEDQLEIRTVETLPRNSLLLGRDRVVVLVTDTKDLFGVGTDSADVVSSLTQGYDEVWTNAEPFDLRTPALSTIRESLRDEFGESFMGEFDTTFEALDPVPRGEDGIDEVVLILLLAAKQEELFYDVGGLGEEISLASKATFSRVKQQLEDTGLIRTEKVPIDVGRPRMRLHLDNDELQEMSGEQFVGKARELIESDA